MNVLLWTSYFDTVNLIFKLSEVGLEIKATTIIHIETRKRGPLTSDVSIWAYEHVSMCVCGKHSKYNWRSLLVTVFVKSVCYRRHMIWSNYIWASVSCSAFTHYIRLLRLLIVLFHFRNWVRWKRIGNAMKSNQRMYNRIIIPFLKVWFSFDSFNLCVSHWDCVLCFMFHLFLLFWAICSCSALRTHIYIHILCFHRSILLLSLWSKSVSSIL